MKKERKIKERKNKNKMGGGGGGMPVRRPNSEVKLKANEMG